MAKRKPQDVSAETDMTPMIDMVFQLIAFFMVLLNFGEGEQDTRIKLPSSELARPPDGPLESPLVLQLTADGNVLYSGVDSDVGVPIPDMGRYLALERQLLERRDKAVADANVIIRADAQSRAGRVQELIQVCQENGFELFKLRVNQTPPDFAPAADGREGAPP